MTAPAAERGPQVSDGEGANGGVTPLDTHSAGAMLQGLFAEPIVETAEAKATRERDASGRFVPKKPDTASASRGDEPVRLDPADGSDDPDDLLPENAPKAKEAPKDGEEPEVEVEATPAPRLVKVKVDGMEVEVEEPELIKGYSRTADYTRKTQALAAERQRFEAEEVAPTRQERAYYAERIAVLEEAIQALSPDAEPDWARMRDTVTPEQFTEQYTNWQAQKQRMERIRAERSAVTERMEADNRREMARRLAQEEEKLKAAIPEWGDAEKGPQFKKDVVDFAQSLEFTEDDIAGVTDHRLILLLNDARQWRQLQRRKPAAEAKIDRALEAMKPSAAQSRTKPNEQARLQGQLAKSGSVEDAARLLNAL